MQIQTHYFTKAPFLTEQYPYNTSNFPYQPWKILAKELSEELQRQGFLWGERGYNVGVVTTEAPIDFRRVQIITQTLYAANCSYLRDALEDPKLDPPTKSLIEGQLEVNYPAINRLDFVVDKSGTPYLVEQNPSWVDNLAFADALSGGITCVTILEQLELFGVDNLVVLYDKSTAPSISDMYAFASKIGLPSNFTDLLDNVDTSNLGPNTAVYFNTNLFSTGQRGKIKYLLDRLVDLGCTIIPSIEGLLESKDLLTQPQYESLTPGTIFCPDEYSEYLSLYNQGYVVCKSLSASSLKGVRLLSTSDLTPKAFELLTCGQLGIEPPFILQKFVDPVLAKGAGVRGFADNQVSKIKERPTKIAVWSVNGVVTASILQVSTDGTNLISDKGFNCPVLI